MERVIENDCQDCFQLRGEIPPMIRRPPAWSAPITLSLAAHAALMVAAGATPLSRRASQPLAIQILDRPAAAPPPAPTAQPRRPEPVRAPRPAPPRRAHLSPPPVAPPPVAPPSVA